jgi:SAM-dependent methyltransferase
VPRPCVTRHHPSPKTCPYCALLQLGTPAAEAAAALWGPDDDSTRTDLVPPAAQVLRAKPGQLLPGIADPIGTAVVDGDTRAWAFAGEIRRMHCDALLSLLKTEFPKLNYGDKEGIVYVGGGRYWPMVAIGIRMARRVTDIPIQVWHSGASEPVSPADLADLAGVTYHDVTQLGYPLRRVGGWENKTTAILHSGFRRMIYLDADAYLVADPRFWLQKTAESGFTFWGDLAWNETTVDWAWSGVQNTRRIPPVQGGQLGIDLALCQRSILLSHWINQHSDYFFHHQYGDQDSWRIAFAASGERYECLGAATWQPPAFACGLPGPLVVHRCQAKLWGTSQVRFDHGLPGESIVRELYNRQVIGTGSPAEVFGRIYQLGMWGDGDSSGAGSSEQEARPFLNTLEFMRGLAGWDSVVDLGCGDGRIARQLPFDRIAGVDVHAPHIARLMREDARLDWFCLDLLEDRDRLPSADIAIVKDVLHHWPTSTIVEWLTWASSCGKWKWIFLVQDVHQKANDDDCILGGYRALHPMMKPLKEFRLQIVGEYLHKAILAMDCRAAGGAVEATPAVNARRRLSI